MYDHRVEHVEPVALTEFLVGSAPLLLGRALIFRRLLRHEVRSVLLRLRAAFLRLHHELAEAHLEEDFDLVHELDLPERLHVELEAVDRHDDVLRQLLNLRRLDGPERLLVALLAEVGVIALEDLVLEAELHQVENVRALRDALI